MVGVPGRSKGCNTCIQRRIRCDQEKPLCGNCRKSNRLCTGYKRKTAYVFSSNVILDSQGESSSEQGTVVHQGRWRKPELPRRAGAAAGRQQQHPKPNLQTGNSLVGIGRQAPTGSMIREQFHSLFLNEHLPSELLSPNRPKSAVSANFLLQLHEVAIESPALETAISAFFAARLARRHNDPNLIHKSRAMYGVGLRHLQQCLRNPRTRLSDETLATCMMLSLYELTEAPVGTAGKYRTHQNGAMMLLEMRGPDACSSPLGLSIFLGIRSQTVQASLQNRFETFLSHPDWSVKPWAVHPKTAVDGFIDLLYRLPGIYRDYDMLESVTDPHMLANGYRNCIKRLREVDSALRDRYADFQTSAWSGPLYWPELSTLDSELDDPISGKLFPISFRFPTYTVAQCVTMYWGGVLATDYPLMDACGKLAALEPGVDAAAQNRKRSDMYRTEWTTMAKNICQSTEYFMAEEMGGMGSMHMLSLLRGTQSCYQTSAENWSNEISWIASMMERLQKRFSFSVDEVLADVE